MISPPIDWQDLSPIARLMMAGGPFVLMFNGMLISAHMALLKNFEEIENLLPKTIERDPFRKSTLLSQFSHRHSLLFSLAGVLIFPKFSIRKGMLDPVEYRNFPQRIRKRMLRFAISTTIGFVWMLFTYWIVSAD